MIHYHGGPITPTSAAMKVWQGRHAMVSFARPDQIDLAAEVCQSFAIDNGAFSMWKIGKRPDWQAYYAWLGIWAYHPGFDFAIIPDIIDGTEDDNDFLVGQWFSRGDTFTGTYFNGVPVWHLNESLDRLKRLMRFPRIALGSSGQFATVGNAEWWVRIAEAMMVLCNSRGMPEVKLHGLRMLNPTVFSFLPLASADSTNVARNIGIDKAWKGPYTPHSKAMRAMILAERIESHASASHWGPGLDFPQENPRIIG